MSKNPLIPLNSGPPTIYFSSIELRINKIKILKLPKIEKEIPTKFLNFSFKNFLSSL